MFIYVDGYIHMIYIYMIYIYIYTYTYIWYDMIYIYIYDMIYDIYIYMIYKNVWYIHTEDIDINYDIDRGRVAGLFVFALLCVPFCFRVVSMRWLKAAVWYFWLSTLQKHNVLWWVGHRLPKPLMIQDSLNLVFIQMQWIWSHCWWLFRCL